MVLKTPASPFYSPRPVSTATTTRIDDPDALSNIPILVTAFLAVLATGGPTYSFGVYSATLKRSLHLSQSQLETLGAASFAAGFIGWIPGLCVDAWGCKKALVVGGLLQSLGLFLYWLVARFRVLGGDNSPLVLPALVALSVLVFTSNNLVIGGVFKSIVVTCGLGTKGKAVGAAKAYLGSGAGVFSALFRGLPAFLGSGSDLDFLAMSSLCAVLATVVPAAFLLPNSQQMEKKGTKDESTALHYNTVYAGLFLLAVAVVGSSAMDLVPKTTIVPSEADDGAENKIPQWVQDVLLITIWIGPIMALFLLPTQSSIRQKNSQRQRSALRQRVRKDLEENPSETMRLLTPADKARSMGFGTPPITKPGAGWESSDDDTRLSNDHHHETPRPVPDLALPEMLRTVRAWLFLFASTILVGSGTMLTINMGQLVQSQEYPAETAAACLALFSVAQALARVLSGAVSEAALRWDGVRFFGIGGVPRPAFLVLSCALAVAGHGVLAAGSSRLGLFVLGVVLTGFSFGALWPLMVLVIGDLFGTVNHGANYMFADGFTCAVGTLSIAKFLSQLVYEKHLRLPRDGDVEDIIVVSACYGDECFRATHLIVSGLCLVALVASAVLLYTTRTSYGSLLCKTGADLALRFRQVLRAGPPHQAQSCAMCFVEILIIPPAEHHGVGQSPGGNGSRNQGG